MPQQPNTANLNAVSTTRGSEEREEKKESADSKSETASSHDKFVNKQREATATYAQAQNQAIHNQPTPPLCGVMSSLCVRMRLM